MIGIVVIFIPMPTPRRISTDEQLPPVPRECLAEYGEDTKETGHKNSTTTADVVVDWVSEHGRYSTDGDRGGRVNHSN